MLYSFARPITNIIGLFLIFLGLTLIFFFQPAHAATKESQIESLTNQLVTSDKKSELELKEIARKRKELLSDAAKNDPELFLKLARLQDKTDLPESVKADLEKTVEADGELMVIHFDNPTHPKTEYKLLRNKKLLNLHFVKEPKNVKTGTKVKL
jgi:predicted adenine nucleotide alpha hydrolase (AANH) superfamily ATPase